MTNELFLEPKTNQYGSHMIMTNVNKPLKTKYVNIDTKFRDEYNYSQEANYNITLPERITDVTSIRVVSAEIPMSFYNISEALGNNSFGYTFKSNTVSIPIVSFVITIPDGNYSINDLITIINSQMNVNIQNYYVSKTNNYPSDNWISFSQSTKNNMINLMINYPVYVGSSKDTYAFNFTIKSDGTSDKFNFKNTLGWLLGFRNPIVDIKENIVSPLPQAAINLYGPKYLYLAIEEFNKGNQSSFVTPMNKSLLNKNIIARIALNRNGGYDFGSVLPTNNFNGLLMSDTRSYTGKIDLMKLNVQLLTEDGTVVNLNGLDFSLCLEVTHE
jgi:hypothetical protein